MNDFSRWTWTYTLAGLYEDQGHLRKAAEIYAALKNKEKKEVSAKEQFSLYPSKPDHGQNDKGFVNLAALTEQWIEMLKRLRFFNFKP